MTVRFAAAAAPIGSSDGTSAAQRHVLPNGMTALIQRNPHSPTVSVRGEIGAGAIYESAEQSGLAAFTGSALIRGTERRTFQQISVETDERGCSVNAGGGLHGSGFSARALAEDLPLVLDILGDMVLHPTFPTHEIEKLRAQFLMGLRENEQETQTQAVRAARALLYPPEHPYSRLLSGTLETVQALSRDDMAAFHQRYYHPATAAIAIVGDVEPDEVLSELQRVFGEWERSEAPPELSLPDVPPLQGQQRRDITMPGKMQADIIWAVHGLKRTDPDYYAAMMANMVLGRLGLGGRLGENVREEQGMAYYVSSGLSADLGAGPWLAVAGVNPGNVERAIESMLHEIERFVQKGPTEQELGDVRSYLTGSLVLGLETNGGIANTLLAIERYGLGLDYIARYPDIINAIDAEEIRAVANAYLSTSDYVLTVAGPAPGSVAKGGAAA
jgi:zinc protease